MLRPKTLLLLTLALASCSSPQTRSLKLVNLRAAQLKPLSTYPSTWCRLDAHLTQPAIARYRAMFPKEVDVLTAESLPYTWKATEATCEVTPLKRSPLSDNYQGFLQTALCLMVQTHFVNSPFDELVINGAHVEPREDRALLRTSDAQDLGLYVEPERPRVETRTKSQGILTADYQNFDGRMLPSRIARRSGTTVFELSDFEYQPPADGQPRTLKGFAIAVGDEHPVAHSQVSVSECQKF